MKIALAHLIQTHTTMASDFTKLLAATGRILKDLPAGWAFVSGSGGLGGATFSAYYMPLRRLSQSYTSAAVATCVLTIGASVGIEYATAIHAESLESIAAITEEDIRYSEINAFIIRGKKEANVESGVILLGLATLVMEIMVDADPEKFVTRLTGFYTNRAVELKLRKATEGGAGKKPSQGDDASVALEASLKRLYWQIIDFAIQSKFGAKWSTTHPRRSYDEKRVSRFTAALT
jgi:hypothetical protein